mmetsp:Transcript_20270/g.61548  ORF Transcript_20270/g.61548 Transcript_20270/m.61548 type:complete len:282 (-) Transcript_20270:148-993(-)
MWTGLRRRCQALGLCLTSTLMAGPTRARAFSPWQCSGASNEELVRNLAAGHIVKTEIVERSMLATDRALFVPEEQKAHSYEDSPQFLGFPQATISAPHMHAAALEYIVPSLEARAAAGAPCRVLDVGSGSGYLLAAAYRLGTELCGHGNCQVVGIEIHEGLAAASVANLIADGLSAEIDAGAIRVEAGNAWDGPAGGGAADAEEDQLFDAIHIGASAPQVPEKLAALLRPGTGTLVVPLGPERGAQQLVRVRRSEDGRDFTTENLFGVRYVPLVKRIRDMH